MNDFDVESLSHLNALGEGGGGGRQKIKGTDSAVSKLRAITLKLLLLA